VRDALASLPWVKNVQVNYDRKQATFVADPGRFDEAAVIAALEKEGFGGKVVQ
jgi:copper chaperone CopZ